MQINLYDFAYVTYRFAAVFADFFVVVVFIYFIFFFFCQKRANFVILFDSLEKIPV